MSTITCRERKKNREKARSSPVWLASFPPLCLPSASVCAFPWSSCYLILCKLMLSYKRYFSFYLCNIKITREYQMKADEFREGEKARTSKTDRERERERKSELCMP